MQPKVSVIIPVYNNERFLRECLDSAVNQTLDDIEIICINDGSTDSSLSILQEYAAKDARVKVIDKPNSGYGRTMNVGLDNATGEYVAFLESDDSIKRTAYETLYRIAEQHKLDIVKGDYYELNGMGNERELTPIQICTDLSQYNKVVHPQRDQWAFYIPMMNCLGLFRRSFLENNRIRHNVTPGAAHQDQGFWFQTFSFAERVMFVHEPFYEYRQDNLNSSMKSDTTTFSVTDEYAFARAKLDAAPEALTSVLPVFFHRKFISAMYHYNRSELSLKLPFLRQIAEEYSIDAENELLDLSRFSSTERERLRRIMEDPDKFYLDSLTAESRKKLKRVKKELREARKELDEVKSSSSWRIGRAATAPARALKRIARGK